MPKTPVWIGAVLACAVAHFGFAAEPGPDSAPLPACVKNLAATGESANFKEVRATQCIRVPGRFGLTGTTTLLLYSDPDGKDPGARKVEGLSSEDCAAVARGLSSASGGFSSKEDAFFDQVQPAMAGFKRVDKQLKRGTQVLLYSCKAGLLYGSNCEFTLGKSKQGSACELDLLDNPADLEALKVRYQAALSSKEKQEEKTAPAVAETKKDTEVGRNPKLKEFGAVEPNPRESQNRTKPKALIRDQDCGDGQTCKGFVVPGTDLLNDGVY